MMVGEARVQKLTVARWLGLLRTRLIYHGNPWRRRSLKRHYRRLIEPGTLCFDIGANVGSRLNCWLQLGARVVAVEPNPLMMRYLRRRYGNHAQATLLQSALGATKGSAALHVSSRTPSVSTLAGDWLDKVRDDDAFKAVKWDDRLIVEVTTLDTLIERFGVPSFCKIDVEGLEYPVLCGLSRPLPLLSFEYNQLVLTEAHRCISRLSELGTYEFNYSAGESHHLQNHWQTAQDMQTSLDSLPSNSGDIYARRISEHRIISSETSKSKGEKENA